MSDLFAGRLGSRERQIMESVYVLREGAVSEVRKTLANPPSYSAVRTTMNILVSKGFLSYRTEGRKYLYRPVIPHERARRTAMRHLLKTYFDGSVRDAVVGLIDADAAGLSEADYRELTALISKARREKARKK